jgi:tetratricopeptide (TPR) repeat protein
MVREAVAIARRLGDRATLAYALDGLHCANWGPDVLEERRAIAEELIEVAESAGDPERAYAGHDYRFYALLEGGNVAAAQAELEIRAGWAQELRQPAHLWDVTASRALLDLFQGRFEAAEAAGQAALALGRSAQSANPRVAFDLQMYALRRAQGRLSEAAGAIERAVDEYPAYPVWRYVFADVLAQLGRTEDAREAFEALAATDFEVHVEMQWLVSLTLISEPCRYLRDAGRAERLYEALRPYARHNATTPPELCLGSVSRGLGILAATMSNWDAATGHFEDALEMNAAMGARPWLAHTQYDYGCMLVARDHRGDRERAHEFAAAARALSDELGMRALSENAARLMRSETSVP